MIKPIKKIIKICINSGLVGCGYFFYLAFGRTPKVSYHAMISLFSLTGGVSNDIFSKLIAAFSKKMKLEDANGILGNIESSRGKQLLSQLRNNGYLVFEDILTSEECTAIESYACIKKSNIRPMDGEDNLKKPIETVFDRNMLESTRYDFDSEVVLEIPEVQKLLSDNSILTIVQEYLGCEPCVDVISMWWHTNYKETADSIAGQYFHFDMDRIKWLKCFIYITDVGMENGPHSFISGTHRAEKIPRDILDRGYSRISDDEIEDIYPKENILQFLGKRGTLILEDTRGLHKGSHVMGDPRLILQLQFSISLFGTNYNPKKIGLKGIKNKNFLEINKKNPNLYKQYIYK